MSAVAGGVRRSWQPVSRMVVWQLQRTAAGSGMRGMSTVTTAVGNSSAIWLSGVAVERSFIRGASTVGVGGEKWKGASLGSLPHVRYSSGNSSAVRKDEDDQPQHQQEESVKTEGDFLKANDLEKSNYWGVTSKTFYRDDGTKWPWNCFRPGDAYAPNYNVDLHKHRKPTRWEEKFALGAVQLIKQPTVWFYRKRYGCRAMMLETVAAVPGMVGGMLLHLRSLRRFEQSGGWIKALLDEAENERMHLMTLMEVVQPAWYERFLVVAVQGIFFNFYFMLYVISPRMAHRVTGYLEEEAIISYTTFLEELDNGTVDNVPAPAIAIDYWRLPKDARFRDVILALRADEAHHRDVNHYAADVRNEGKQLHESPAPVDYH